MISISTVRGSEDGNVILDIKPDLRENIARVSRYATLDGEAVTIHGGTSDGDRTFDLNGRISEEASEKFWNIFQEGKFVLVGIPEGVFLATIKVLRLDNGSFKSTIYINNKESV